MVSRSFLFVFHTGSRGLGCNNSRNSSYKEKMAGSACVSRLSVSYLFPDYLPDYLFPDYLPDYSVFYDYGWVLLTTKHWYVKYAARKKTNSVRCQTLV